MHTIGDVSRMTGLSVSTLRYYGRQGLRPGMVRESGFRRFGDEQLEALRVIECLKASGLEIRDIKQFMDWCAQGPSTLERRRALFDAQLVDVENKIAELERVRAMIEFKRWYYARAVAEGGEDFAAALPDVMPVDVRAHYDRAHS